MVFFLMRCNIAGFLCILLASAISIAVAAPPEPPAFAEVIQVPYPAPEKPPPSARNLGEVGPLLQTPTLLEQPQPPTIQPALPAASDTTLPINLPTALYLSNARPLLIAFARTAVEQAAARLQNANVLWLPNVNIGTDYYRHDGTDQTTEGRVILDNKNNLAVGAGATLNFAVTDAIFRPLAERQELAARQWDVQTAQNDALLAVALAYFDVQQARGNLAGLLDSSEKARLLAEKTAGLSKGLVAGIEVDRARALLLDLQQQVAASRANWRIASARLTRVLRLDPGAVVVPLEPPHLQVSLITQDNAVANLIPVALTNRPELASQRAVVQASLERVQQERLRPMIPNIVAQGRNGPNGGLNGGLFGGGPDNDTSLYGGRFDMEVGVLWTLNNLGAGNQALVRERVAQQQRAAIEFANLQDQVAQEVVQGHAQVEATAIQVAEATKAVKEALITFEGTLRGIGETRGAGDLLQLINRPQEAVAALQQLNRAYDLYFTAINNYNRAQFQLYRALGFPSRMLSQDGSVGEVQPIDTSRPYNMTPVWQPGP